MAPGVPPGADVEAGAGRAAAPLLRGGSSGPTGQRDLQGGQRVQSAKPATSRVLWSGVAVFAVVALLLLSVAGIHSERHRSRRQLASASLSPLEAAQEVKGGLPLLEIPAAAPDEYRSASLYCFSLAIPDSYEPKLLRFQYEERVSIFACEEYALFSNKPIDIAPEVNTSHVDSDLICDKGGEFGTALNLKIFLAVWTAVIRDGRFLYHGWTVKVDPDTVFFPARLRGLLANHTEPPNGNGLYLNNCKYGLHGPMEVFSRKAVQAWAQGAAQCVRHFHEVCSGDCFWGEDMFIDQCLSKVLKVKRADEFRLLTEDHCDAPSNWRWCRDPVVAAFHPFKSPEGWKSCMDNATA